MALSRMGAIFVACTGGLVLLGWLFEISLLKSVAPGLATMKANTAGCFLGAGLSLALYHVAAGPRGVFTSRLIAVAVAAIGCLTWIEDLWRVDLGLDEILFVDDPNSPGVIHHGRMSPGDSVSFTFAGLALLCLSARSNRLQSGVLWCATPVHLIAALALIGYVTGASSLYRTLPYASMAAHTALCLWVLSVALAMAVPAQGFMKVVTSETAGGFVARRLLLIIPVALYCIGWARVAGENAGWYDERFGLALMIFLSIVFTISVVLWHSSVLYRVDQQRQEAEAEIVALNAGLEREVHDRTQELRAALTQVRQLNDELEVQSLTDSLTGLANRRAFDRRLHEELNHAERYETPLSLVLLDADHFKVYNDTFGHPAGDAVLRELGRLLRGHARDADFAARYGGEEFALLLPHTDRDGAVAFAERLQSSVAMFPWSHRAVTISMGITTSADTPDAAGLLAAADRALYEAKARGRNCFVYADTAPWSARGSGPTRSPGIFSGPRGD